MRNMTTNSNVTLPENRPQCQSLVQLNPYIQCELDAERTNGLLSYCYAHWDFACAFSVVKDSEGMPVSVPWPRPHIGQ